MNLVKFLTIGGGANHSARNITSERRMLCNLSVLGTSERGCV